MILDARKMIKGAICAVLMGFIAPDLAHANVADCMQIDSDLERLRCYDTALNRGGGPTLSPDEAYDALLQSLAYSSDLAEVTMYQLNGPCHVQVSLKRLKPINGGYSDALMVVSAVNFANVERLDRWRNFFSLGSAFPKGLVLNYARGSEGSWTSWQRRAQFPGGIAAYELTPPILGESNTYSGRDAMLVILPQEIAVDQQPIYAAVQGLVRACAG
jgi:hypothetical protein